MNRSVSAISIVSVGSMFQSFIVIEKYLLWYAMVDEVGKI